LLIAIGKSSPFKLTVPNAPPGHTGANLPGGKLDARAPAMIVRKNVDGGA